MRRRLLPPRVVVALAAALLAVACGPGFSCGGEIDEQLEALRAVIVAGRAVEAVAPLRELVEAHPERADAQHLLGVAYLQTGQTSLAIFPLEKAAEDPGYAAASNAALAPAYLALENFDAAVEAASRVLEAEPGQLGMLAVRARAQLGAGDFDAALADADAMLAAEVDSYEGLLLRGAALGKLERGEEAEQAYLRLREVARQDPQLAPRGCLALASFYEESGRPGRAQAVTEACLSESPGDLLTLQLAVEFFDRRGEPERARAILTDALARSAEDLGLRAALAQRLLFQGEPEAAERWVREGTQLQPDSPEAWRLLAQLHRQLGRPQQAAAALERAAERLSDDAARAFVRFEQADLAIDAGDLDRAEALASKLERAEYRELLRGRILLERGRAEESLAAFEAGTRLWPNNAYARYLAGVAAHRAGQRDKARKHLREATRARVDATDAAYELARLYLEEGRYEDAAGMVARHLEGRGTHAAEALRLAARAYTGMGRHGQALQALEAAGVSGADPLRLALDRAAARRAADGSAAAARNLVESGIDLTAAESGEALATLVEDLAVAGRAPQARAWLARAVAHQGETPELLALRGRLALATEDPVAARRAFQAALAADPGNATATLGLADLARQEGDLERALALYDEAAADDVGAAYRASQLLIGAGRVEEAEQRLRAILARKPSHAFASNDLAWLLANQERDLETALELASRAVRLRPAADTLDTLAWVQLKSGRPDAAAISFRQALERAPQNPTLWYHLALARLAQGDEAAAREALEKALAQGPFADAEAARAALEQLGAAGGLMAGEPAIRVQGIDHVVLRVRDLERALAFYCGALGCCEERRLDALGLVQLRAGTSLIDLVPVDGPLGRAGGPPAGEQGRNVDHLALRVEHFDEAAWRQHLAAHGIEMGDVAERYGAEGNGPSVYLRDPDGNVVELKGPSS